MQATRELTKAHAFRYLDRLTNAEQFARVFQRGIRLGDRYFKIVASRNGLRHARLGLAISRRAAGGAVDRNRIKRVIREEFRQHRVTLPEVDIIVAARAASATASNRQLRRSLDALWRRIAEQCASS